MKMEFPFYAMTFAGAKVECWEWDEDAEQWVDTNGHCHEPEDLHSVAPPFDENPPTFYGLPIAMSAVALDGKRLVLGGFRPLLRSWETPDGELHLLVNCPRPVLTQRYRSLDAPWLS